MTLHRLPEADLRHILDHTRDLWPQLRGARLFVTGGTGFFGKWLMGSLDFARRELGLRDLQAAVLTRGGGAVEGFESIRGDVRDFGFPEGARFTHVIHGATPASAALNASRPTEMFDIIVAGTRRVLEFGEACGAQDLLLCSSGAVYGRQPLDVSHMAEEHMGGPDPLAAGSAYGEGKRVSEWLCTVSRMKRVVPARCYAFLGPHLPLDAHFAAGNFLGDALAGRDIVIGGDGTPLRSYLHPADLAIWLWTLLVKGSDRRAYNVGCERAVSIAELAEMVRVQVNPAVRVEVRGVAAVAAGRAPERYVPSTGRARVELGLETRIPLEEAIRRTAAWHRAS